MYLTVCQQLKHLSKEEFFILRELCHTAFSSLMALRDFLGYGVHYFALSKLVETSSTRGI